ncbi:DUF2726 domain-containing protein [Acinetobacter shaoyimingii]|uniref:DUF2726 domain-containing protein n=1 Tax=Acinetobacter shaoyimingii TaxID=2715164 RepID=A0A6G8RZM4_9GAMM|nr:DUF2726 domain-containing protein [Acinetobacter shaoyimingii]QIO07183.1 DUF2726 domain-containing protein [Acinetobacter shaoyimingii]
MNIIIFTSIAIFVIILIVAYRTRINKPQSDSALRQRAVFNAHEQTTFKRLKEIMPEANILAHVSFDALMTTKFPHTRRKYEKMFADFVVLDKECRVIAIVAVGELNSLKKWKAANDQDTLLEAAGYKVFRYKVVPEYQKLRDDFEVNTSDIHTLIKFKESQLGKFEQPSSDHGHLKRASYSFFH